MKILRWNLAENATRNQLLGDTLLQLPPDTRQRLEAAADAAGVPDRHHHDIGEVLATIDGLVVSPAVRDHMRAIYTILAEAEAAAHGCAVEQTHFHEVGDGSRIRNTLLVCLAVEASGRQSASWPRSRKQGRATVECAHGDAFHPGSGNVGHHRPWHPRERAHVARRAHDPHERGHDLAFRGRVRSNHSALREGDSGKRFRAAFTRSSANGNRRRHGPASCSGPCLRRFAVFRAFERYRVLPR